MSKTKREFANYHRLSFKEREEISRYLARGKTIRSISLILIRSPSTISREIKRSAQFGRKENYRAIWANFRAKRNRKKQGRKRKLDVNKRLKRYVFKKLSLYWSPEQIAIYLKIEYPLDISMRIAKETIYRYIYVQPKGKLKRSLIEALRRSHKRRYKKDWRANIHKGNKSIPNLISIEERPEEVKDRTVPGHWEGDLLIGKLKRSALGSLVERTSRKTILVPLLKGYNHERVAENFSKELGKVPQKMRKTMTYDQGSEMSSHEKITEKTKIKVYFSHGGSPWERGTNENTNGLVRQFFPKGTDFTKVSKKEIKQVEKLLNGRPRKVLHWKKPEEVFNELLR
ncbi:MAG: IS30 family transposase [Candidatus Subteraquimicrobiales bacterium]|nr:IS30 family transposase [Candidatus Subteraquimicrobiales bacterium]